MPAEDEDLLHEHSAQSPKSSSVHSSLKFIHQQNSTRAIEGPDPLGGFPSAWWHPVLLGGVPPIVVDANIFRSDIAYACKYQRRTVLITGANSGYFRLFCAEHVLREVFKHGERWANEKALSPKDYFERWESEYLPLIRVVKNADQMKSLLTREERLRIATLATKDPDDVPSVCLSLVLGAFFLSKDNAALDAVYGPTRDRTLYHKWRETLYAGGDLGQLDQMLTLGSMVTANMIAGGASYLRAAVRELPPWVVLIAGVAAGIGIATLRRRTINSMTD